MKKPYKNKTKSLDAIFEVLANQRRRYALHYLKKHETQLAVADLAKEITAWENDVSITDVSPEDVKQTHLSLYHTHIPKLKDASIVHHDEDKDIVELAENSEQLWQYTETLETR